LDRRANQRPYGIVKQGCAGMSNHIASLRGMYQAMIDGRSLSAHVLRDKLKPKKRKCIAIATPEIARRSKQPPSSFQKAFEARQALTALGLLRGRMYCAPDRLPFQVGDAHQVRTICGLHLGVDLSVDEAEIFLRLRPFLSDPTEHERQWAAAKHKATADGKAGQGKAALTGLGCSSGTPLLFPRQDE